ncbi:MULTISPECIES: type IV pilin [Halolamina]|uniref:Archaeal Type IV pilin N-terminal domain-containing protein n=1 Tax=Halolamina pelagica TaxID=699431 RepID=A0A1I5QPE9_9EURY|nr:MULTISPECIES: type IV pilin [Halolamina]NHX35467.1 type IV pilin [Halolamina sp. R1-12]SFP47746.1 Protein of unknown function [Halolamina pelagica]
MTDRAQSEAIGIILLTGVIVISVGTAGAFVLSGSGVASGERITADVSIEIADDGVGLTHEGGDSVPFDELRVVVRHGNETWRPPVNASGVRNGDGDDQFDPTEQWVGNRTLDTDVVTKVQIFHVESGTLLAEARRYPSQESLTAAPSAAVSDTTDPSVSVTSPSGGEEVRGGTDVTVEWNASDANTSVETIDIQYSNGGGSWQTLVTNTADDGAESVQLPVDNTDDARIRVRAVDDAGNTAFAESPTFTVDSDQPSISSISPNASSQAEVDAVGDGWENVTVSWTASDATTSVGDVTVSIQNTSETVATVNASGPSGTVDVSLPNDTAEDVYDVEVEVVDSVGNGQQRAAADAVVVGDGGNDTTPPTISPFELTNPSGKQLNVTFESSEPLSAINVTITRNGKRDATLTESDFSRTGSGQYSATYYAGKNGDYTATLNVAADDAGNDGALGQTSTVSLTGPPGAGDPVIQNFSGFTASSDRDLVTVGNVTAEQFANGEDMDSVVVEVRDTGGSRVGSTSLDVGKNADRVSVEDVEIDAAIDAGTTYNVTVVATSTSGASASQSETVAGDQTQAGGPFIDEFGSVTADHQDDQVRIDVLSVSDDTQVKNVTIIVEEEANGNNAEFNEIKTKVFEIENQSETLSPVIDLDDVKNKDQYRITVTVYDEDGNSVTREKTVTGTK